MCGRARVCVQGASGFAGGGGKRSSQVLRWSEMLHLLCGVALSTKLSLPPPPLVNNDVGRLLSIELNHPAPYASLRGSEVHIRMVLHAARANMTTTDVQELVGSGRVGICMKLDNQTICNPVIKSCCVLGRVQPGQHRLQVWAVSLDAPRKPLSAAAQRIFQTIPYRRSTGGLPYARGSSIPSTKLLRAHQLKQAMLPAHCGHQERMLQDFSAAVEIAERYSAAKVYSTVICNPDLVVVDPRPDFHFPELMGTPCEPWLDRTAIEILDRLLKPHWRGLEWGVGSSTNWLLLHLQHLTSIEHDGLWLEKVGVSVKKLLPAQITGVMWEGHLLAQGAAYAKPPPRVLPEGATYEVVVVDGWEGDGSLRLDCLRTAIQRVSRPGVLVLDNAGRHLEEIGRLGLIPGDWAFHIARNPVTTTVVWIASEPACSKAAYS